MPLVHPGIDHTIEQDRDVAEPWTCPTCGAFQRTDYCSTCGEKPLSAHDLTLFGLVGHAVESLTHVDGRVFRSVRDLIGRPGTLTLAFVRGRRKPYFAPFQLFLVANIVFFVVQSALGFQLLTNDLGSHIGAHGGGNQFYAASARPMVERRLEDTGRTIEQYSGVFNHAVRVNAKALVVLLVPGVAFVVLASFPRASHPLVTAMVFGLHFVAFFLLLEAVLMPVVGIPAGVALRAAGLLRWWDPLTSALLLGICGAWAYRAYRTVYEVRPLAATLRAAILAAMLVPLLIAYRFVVFLVTLYTT